MSGCLSGTSDCSTRYSPRRDRPAPMVNCPTCGTPSEAGRKFCAECGTPLTSVCATCGATNSPTARFCRRVRAPPRRRRPGERLPRDVASTPGARREPGRGRRAAARVRPVRRPRRLHAVRRGARRGGGPRAADPLLRPGPRGHRALRRHRREVHRRRGDGGLGRAGRPRGRRRARRPSRASTSSTRSRGARARRSRRAPAS